MLVFRLLGQPKSYLGATLTWRGRELSQYAKGNTQIFYSYDVDGMRYQKIVKNNGTETSRYDYVYSDGKLILLTHTANGTANTARFIYDSFGEPRGFILNNTSAYLYLKNGQGDITAIVDENGEILVRYTYSAWGEVEFIVPFGIDPAVTTILATVSPFTYRGYCYDFDLGLYYLQSRYYDPVICRFINADSTDYLGATGTLLSYNLFAYCENDGVNCVDATGNVSIAFKYTTNTTTIVNKCRSLFESSGNSKLFKNSLYIGALRIKPYVMYNYLYYTSGKHKGSCYFYYMDTWSNVIHNRYSKQLWGKVICLTVKEWKAYLVSMHYTFMCKARDKIEWLIGEDNFGLLLDWIEMCAEAGGHPYIQCGAMVLNWALEVFEYYEYTFNTRFDKYILNSISGRGVNDMVAIVISASNQQYSYNGRYYAWRQVSTIVAY